MVKHVFIDEIILGADDDASSTELKVEPTTTSTAIKPVKPVPALKSYIKRKLRPNKWHYSDGRYIQTRIPDYEASNCEARV